MTASTKAPRYYPAEDDTTTTKKKKTIVVRQNPPRLRRSITPGTILILLAGRFRGKRVVCLKAPLSQSGLLLVTGPYQINGVPLRRVNPAYVIATSTKIDLSSAVTSSVEQINDDYFSRTKDETKSDEEAQFFAGDAPKPAIVSEQRKADQQAVDAALMKEIAKTNMLEGYLAAHFTLSANDKPHKMKF